MLAEWKITVVRLGGSSLPVLGVWTGLSTNYNGKWGVMGVAWSITNIFAAHTFVLSKKSSIRDSVDATYHMRIYQVKQHSITTTR